MSTQRIFLDPTDPTTPANILMVPVGQQLHNGLRVAYPYYFVAVDGTDAGKLLNAGWVLHNEHGIPPVGCHLLPYEWLTCITFQLRVRKSVVIAPFWPVYTGGGAGTAASHRAQESITDEDTEQFGGTEYVEQWREPADAQEYKDTTTEFGGEPAPAPKTRTSYSEMQEEYNQARAKLLEVMARHYKEDPEFVMSESKKLIQYIYNLY